MSIFFGIVSVLFVRSQKSVLTDSPSLVIEFCQQGEFYRLAEKFVFCCIFLPAGVGLSFAGNVPFSLRFETLHLSGGFRLEQNQKTAKRLFRTPFSAGVWVSEVTAEGLEKT